MDTSAGTAQGKVHGKIMIFNLEGAKQSMLNLNHILTTHDALNQVKLQFNVFQQASEGDTGQLEVKQRVGAEEKGTG